MIVTAFSSASPLGSRAPSQIMFMPSGTHSIYCRVNGEPKELEVNVTAKTARLLQQDLEELLGRNVEPFIDFDHKGEASAATPKRFVWKPEGVFLELEWTKKGKESVEGRDYRYFSPTFELDAQGNPTGLPSNGAIGALTNNPSFRDIQRVAASHAGKVSVKAVDPVTRMQDQRIVIAHFRRANPNMPTDEVFRRLRNINPEFFRD